MTVIETIEYGNFKIEMWADENYDDFNDPRQWENVGTMVCWHPSYVLGDIQVNPRNYNNIQEILDEFVPKDSLVLPLYLIDHSGITMNTGGFAHCDPQGWDSGQVGFIYLSDDVAIEQGLSDKNDAELREILNNEVKVYASYLEGDVVGYTITDENDELLESCGGYVGEYDYALEEAKRQADWLEEAAQKEAIEASLWAARDVMTV